jgi:hypothetical protein
LMMMHLSEATRGSKAWMHMFSLRR